MAAAYRAAYLNNYSTPIGHTSNSHTYNYGALASSFAVTANQPLVRPVHFRSVQTVAAPSANIRWASAEAVNFMDHLYFITNFVLDYLLENDLPQELMNQTLLNDPVAVLTDHRNELIAHFHKLLIAACACLCVGISIPLFGFMIACCWCSGGSNKKRSSSAKHRSSAAAPYSARSGSRSRARRDSESDWLAMNSRSNNGGASGGGGGGGGGSSSSGGHSRQHHRDLDRRRRHGRGHRRTNAPSSSSTHAAHHRSRSVPPSLKYESGCHACMRTFFSSNLFITLLLISFFAVSAFVTNEYVNNGVKQLPKAFNQSVDEIQVYLNNTDYEVDNLFRVNYKQLENEINLRLDTSGMIIKHKLAVLSDAIALINLTDIVVEFNDTKYRLERLDRELLTLKSKLSLASVGLADFRSKIANCNHDQCPILRKKYQNLNMFTIYQQYENLPDVKNLIKQINQLIESGIVKQVAKGKEEFERIGTYIQREVNGSTSDVKMQLAILGKKLSFLASDFSQSIRLSDHFFNQTRTSTKKLNQYTEYEQYRRYASLGAASVILFILLCYTLGWLYGSCRPQPTPRTYKTHFKTSSSASFPFSCGIFTVFLLFLPMILAAIGLFMTGSVGDKVVCRLIKHPEQKQSKQIYAMLQNKFLGSNLSVKSPEEDKVMIEQTDGVSYKIYKPNYADLITRCHQNQSIYKVLRLDQYDKVYLTDDHNRSRKIAIGFDKNFNLNSTYEFKRVNNLETKLKKLISVVNLDTSKVVLLSPQAEMILRQSMDLSFDEIELSFSRLLDKGVAISPIDIEQLVKDINAQKATLTDGVKIAELEYISILATNFNDHLLPNITSSLLNLKEGIRHMKLRMFHGRNSFSTVITELIAKVRSAEKQLSGDGKTLLSVATNEFIDELNALIDQYANHIRNQVENVIGQCEPVSRALNSTTSTLCDDIILPFNGYWLSVAASLILILPATLLAYALRGLYKLVKRDPAARSHHHNFSSYTDHEDDVSYEDDGEEIALAYHIGHHSHHLSHKPSGSSGPSAPSAPVAASEGGWSPSSPAFVHNSRPPPYAV